MFLFITDPTICFRFWHGGECSVVFFFVVCPSTPAINNNTFDLHIVVKSLNVCFSLFNPAYAPQDIPSLCFPSGFASPSKRGCSSKRPTATTLTRPMCSTGLNTSCAGRGGCVVSRWPRLAFPQPVILDKTLPKHAVVVDPRDCPCQPRPPPPKGCG